MVSLRFGNLSQLSSATMIDPRVFISGRVLGTASFLCVIGVIMAVTVFSGSAGQAAQKEKSHEVHLTKIK